MPDDMPVAATCAHKQSDTRYRKVVGELLPVLELMLSRQPIQWSDVEKNMCLIGARFALTRQFESLRAAVKLCDIDLGHLAVGFVRPACEELLWLQYLATLDESDAHDVYLALGNNDTMRSAQATQDFLGVEAMTEIGFPRGFSEFLAHAVPAQRKSLKAVGQSLGWPPRTPVPSTQWISEQVGQRKLYDYLYAASSRAVHFSAGEGLRRAWGDPGGSISVEDVHHRLYLADFALWQLTKLLLQTISNTEPWQGELVPRETDCKDDADAMDRLSAFQDLPGVPLVTAREYELIWKSDGTKHGST
ncbi:DUF5677 domain-containing protein [Rhodococcus sp. IEGM 1302]|uniref:DUF5677 domain-containing protein n=1 Tax=Rhodococcus sp. IEGM 1302 TaxID=3047093 RepID=UPI0024B75E92|nr:DUF5677 domain-containing protein [Rhodococcus sp. IEGM 1302]MDI9947014.1 DUF5677 domain-containing protein [Rhodococcus sp. IEGM 1302]